MALPSMNDFLNMLQQSRLFEDGQLQRYLKHWKDEESTLDPDDVSGFANWLVSHQYLTQWQQDNIFAGKYKGFFLGQYKLLRVIGVGGMSSVYLAEHTLLQRQVAIKVLPKSRVTSESSYLERFLLEAQAVAALAHPNIVCAYDIDNEGGSIYYLVMEYVEGQDLLSTVKKEGPLDIYRAADYIRQAAEGLDYAHNAGLIHRDMKPANLLVDQRGVVRILDMGLARFTDEKRASLTVAYDENVLGTADYLAPEQARNSHTVDARADIYGLGCTFYYLLVGHVPFPEGTLPQRIWAHQKKMPKQISLERPEVPEDLAKICWRMMAKDPNDRQQTAKEVAEDLTDWLLDHGQKVAGLSSTYSKRKTETNGSSSEVSDLSIFSKFAEEESKKLGGSSTLSGTYAKRQDGDKKTIRLVREGKSGELDSNAARKARMTKTASGSSALRKRNSSGTDKNISEEKIQQEQFLQFLNQKQRFRPNNAGENPSDDSVQNNVLNFVSLQDASRSSIPNKSGKKGYSPSLSGTRTSGSRKTGIHSDIHAGSGRNSGVSRAGKKTPEKNSSGNSYTYKTKKAKKISKEVWIVLGVLAVLVLILLIIIFRKM
ncbi:MAG: serine/threonine-protein kinase [Planctomycetia bacterium]|nr:serine/threonine-protein kinase [Planctomycetia bacterium]